MPKLTKLITAILLIVAAGARAGNPPPVSGIREVSAPFPGVLYVPDDGKPHPGLIVLHGSEGGAEIFAKQQAQVFAKYGGFAALALCYFGCSDSRVPAQLFDVDLGKTYDAFLWLRSSSYVAGKKTALYGTSRGAEQVLVLATFLSAHKDHFILPDAVAVHAPSAFIVGGDSPQLEDPKCWTGNAVGKSDWLESCGGYGPNHPAWTWRGSTKGLDVGSAIPIERYPNALFDSQGLYDQVWPVTESFILERRLKADGAQVSQVKWINPAVSCNDIPKDALPISVLKPIPFGIRAEFNWFACENHVMSWDSSGKMLMLAIDFLDRNLGE